MRTLAAYFLRLESVIGSALVLAMVLVAVFSQSLAPRVDDFDTPPNFLRVGRSTDMMPHPPDPSAPLGTLPAQLSVYYTLVWGTRSALRFGVIVAASTALLGVLIGATSGYTGGWLQRLTLPVVDAFLAFPAIAGYWVVHYALFPRALGAFSTAIQAIIPPTVIQEIIASLHLDPLMIALILFSWMPYARIMNASALRLRQIEYVQAARALGAGRFHIIFRHIIPNLIAPVLVLAARDVGGSVMLAAAFTFIGVGGDLPWGELLALGRAWIVGPGGNLVMYWWVYAPATVALLLFGISWNLLGDSLNDMLAGRRGKDLRHILANPWTRLVAALLLGLALGLGYSWAMDPVQLTDATPAQLRPDLRSDYLKMAIDSFSVDLDVAQAVTRYERLGALAADTLYRVERRRFPVSAAALDGFRFAMEAVGAGRSPPESSPPAPPGWIGYAAGSTLVVLALFLGIRLARGWRRRHLAIPHPSASSPETLRFHEPPAAPAPSQADSPAGGLLATFRATYTHGPPSYDEAFTLEDSDGLFLGECGVGATAATDHGPAARHAALDVWLFDRSTLKTSTIVLLTPSAHADSGLRARLAGRATAVAASPGSVHTVRTARLVLQIRLAEVVFLPDARDAQASFDRVVLELGFRQPSTSSA